MAKHALEDWEGDYEKLTLDQIDDLLDDYCLAEETFADKQEAFVAGLVLGRKQEVARWGNPHPLVLR